MKKVNAKYSPSTNRITISANSTEFYPMYLKYLFEYLKVPANATIVFNDTTIKGGINAWLANNNDKEYKNVRKKSN